MTRTKIKLLILFFFPLGFLLNRLFKAFPDAGEKIYSTGLNKSFIQVLSRIMGVFSFSVAEILLYILLASLVVFIVFTGSLIIKDFHQFFSILLQFLLTLGTIASIVYILFLLMWGLNYKRPSFAETYAIKAGTYTTEELGELYQYLLNEASRIRESLPEDENGVMTTLGDAKDIFERAGKGYKVAAQTFDKLKGNYGRVKPILASPWMNYTGITGIYSPFTGEPNVNTAILTMDIPATATHEMAHQRGYAFEDECNFIAFLVCSVHPDLDFQYSGYILAIAYTSNALAKVNLPLLQNLNTTMSEKVYNDLLYHNQFWSGYKSPAEDLAKQVNDSYLQANGVPSGVQSYGQVVDLLLSYYDKFL